MRLLEVNGVSLLGATHNEAVNALRSATHAPLHLVVCYGYTRPDKYNTVSLYFKINLFLKNRESLRAVYSQKYTNIFARIPFTLIQYYVQTEQNYTMPVITDHAVK